MESQLLFYDRRKSSAQLQIEDRRNGERRKLFQVYSPERRRLASQVRRYEREAFKIPVHLDLGDKREETGYTHDISPEGLMMFSQAPLSVGMPLALVFSFGENICSLSVAGRVVSSRLVEEGGSLGWVTSVKFSDIQDFERNILTSALREFRKSAPIQKTSLLNVLISKSNPRHNGSTSFNGISIKTDRNHVIHNSTVHASKIIGWGSYLPEKQVMTSDINAFFDARAYRRVGDVIKHLTGIRARHFASDNQYPSDLAAQASFSALKDSGVDPKDLDVVIFCGVSRDVEEPATANILREKIGAKNAYVFDVSNACNGFVSAVDILDSFIASGRCQVGLVAAGEVMSQYINWAPRSRTDMKQSAMGYTFGDGGGAAVLCRTQKGENRGIQGRWSLSASSYWNVAVIPLMNESKRLFRSNGAEIERIALNYVPIGVEELMKSLNWSISDIDLIIPHQVSLHIIRNLFYKRLGVPSEKIIWTFPDHGNVGAASMPIAVSIAREEGRLRMGNKVLLVGGSGGFGVGVIGLIV